MGKRSYKDLVVWRRAMDLVPELYCTTNGFPADERYGLTDQIRRAAVSIPTNIAEGQAPQHGKEFVQFLSIARGCLAKLNTLLILAESLGYLTSRKLSAWEERLAQIGRPLSGLITRLRSR